uniref:CW-type domain-containing protein n=1 Tax=Vitis vinifera TaxID=29760 RepID=F6HPZ9_VITVI
MISVGSRDGRKGLGLGFGVGREMEDTAELEEGEAYYYKDGDDDDGASIDPDVALSYIDEKLQDVLGHFQKDFEGGVSAENLGAKFGGYGSFLPTYQRSPVWSQPRTPAKVQNCNTPRSPNNLLVEGGRHSSAVSSSAPSSVKLGATSASAGALPALKATSMSDSVKRDAYIASTRAEEFTSRESANKSANQPDQKTLKVRIKVGSDNLSARKNAEIYSGLGLDGSPSSSLENSLSESDELSRDPQDGPDESPTSILQIMTSFPLLGDLLLSPLPDDLIHLTEKERLFRDTKSGPVHKSSRESLVMFGSDSVRSDGKVSGEKKTKSVEKSSFSVDMKNGSSKEGQNGVGVIPKKEMDFDVLACEELVSNALKLPLLSNAFGDSTKGTGRASDILRESNKGVVRDKLFSDTVQEELLEPIANQEVGWVDKPNGKVSSSLKVWEDKKANSLNDASVYLRKDGNRKGEKTYNSIKADSNASKEGKVLNAELIEPPKLKAGQKATPYEQDSVKLPSGKEHTSSGAKKNLVDNYTPKSELEDIKLRKEFGKPKDRYKDFFGDINLEQEENGIDSLEMPSDDRLKESDMPPTSGAYPKAATNTLPPTGNGPNSNAAPAAVAPVVIEENWVCCDKCQKWRLLPIGINPDHLPEKWLCSMLSWLPGMNRCSISEEETTKALIALYQAPAPESQHNLQSRADSEISNATNHDGPTQFSNSLRKNLQTSVKSRSLNDVNQSPLANELDFQHLSKSSDLALEKQRLKQKEKHKPLECYSDGGDTKNSKMKNKSGTDQDCVRASKKIKIEGMHSTDEDWTSDHGGTNGKVHLSSSNGLPANVVSNNHFKHNDGSLNVGKYDSRDIVAKKRKVKECQDTEIYSSSLPSTGHHLEDSGAFVKEEFSESDHRKEKKARVSKSEGKEFIASKSSGRTDKKVSSMRTQQQGQDLGSVLSQRSLDGVDSLKRDLGSVQPSVAVAATSSSSKVSGSHKTKTNFQEVRGSPVESVSSSPLRISNPEKHTSVRRNLMGKDDSRDVGFFAMSPRRCSDGEDDGGSERSGAMRKNKIFTVTHRGSLDSSVLDFQERDFSHLSGSKVQVQPVPSPEFTNRHFLDAGADTLGQVPRYPSEPQASDRGRNEERKDNNHYRANGSRPKKSGKGSSSRSKDKNRSFKSTCDEDKIKISDSFNESQNHMPSYEEKPRDAKNKFQEKFGSKSDRVEKNPVSKKDSAGKFSTETSKKDNHAKFGGHDSHDVKVEATCGQDEMSTPKQDLLQECDGERTSKRILSEKTDRVEIVSGRGKLLPLPPSGAQNEMLAHGSRPTPGSHKGNGADNLSVDASEGDEALKVSKQIRKTDNQNGSLHTSSRHPTPNGHRIRDPDAPSPVRRDSSSQAATNAVKEAKDLKHLADRLKHSGSNLESMGFYFQAALKFLHGASLLESSNSENAKHEMIQSMQMYSSTAKLCEYCAHEYEKNKDMAAAALAYKCVEVAYMRVIYSSHNGANRDRHELQTALQMVPPGESPSSSASDVDNLNHPVAVDKVAFAKGVGSPQVAGNHVIAAQKRPNFVRLLSFANDVNSAMEASRKSRLAFAAANANLEETQHKEGISSIKQALDYNFHDVEGLLRLVRLAMEAISR